jgi:uncharacterized protein YjbI with pentapeptide repeats
MREANLVETDLRRTLLCGADLTGARTTGTRMEDADLRGATVDSSVWTTASLGGRLDIAPALAYAAAHGLRLDGARDQ